MPVLNAPTYLWTVEEYEKLNDADIFTASDRVELLNGEIVIMSPIGYRHHTAVSRLMRFFIRRTDDRCVVGGGTPFVLDEHSEPQPDVCLFDPKLDTQGHHAGADQVYLAIEVADSSLRYDREDKRPAYARRGVKEFWILNLQQNVLEVYRDPAGDTYRDARTLGPDATIAPLSFPDVELRVGDFIP